MARDIPRRARRLVHQRYREDERRAVSRLREDVQTAAECLSAFVHAPNAVAGIHATWIESTSVVADAQQELVWFCGEVDIRLGTAGMTHHVVDRFFEEEKHFAAYVCAHADVAVCRRSAKPDVDVARGTEIADEVPHALRQIAEMVPARIDCPHDIAHGIHELA